MGLDITAYSNLESVGHTVLPWCEDEDHIETYTYDSFPRSFKGIAVTETSDDLLHGGCFRATEITETYSFAAGSYGGYNRWRADLQEQFNPNQLTGKPFYELIWFADNEGVIGPEAAAELLHDFHKYDASYFSSSLRCRQVFDDFAKAAALAADHGLIQFH